MNIFSKVECDLLKEALRGSETMLSGDQRLLAAAPGIFCSVV